MNVKNLKTRIHSGTLSASRIRFQNVILFISLEMAMVQRLRTSRSVELWFILAQGDEISFHPCSVRQISFWTYVFQNYFVGIIFMIILEEQNRNIMLSFVFNFYCHKSWGEACMLHFTVLIVWRCECVSVLCIDPDIELNTVHHPLSWVPSFPSLILWISPLSSYKVVEVYTW